MHHGRGILRPSGTDHAERRECAPYQDNCNLEHPWLSKAFIAAGIAIFGDNTFGWRIFNVILGTFSIPVLFGVCWMATEEPALLPLRGLPVSRSRRCSSSIPASR